MPINAAALQAQYGQRLLAPPLNTWTSSYLLHKALHNLQPPVDVSYQAVRTWWQSHRPVGAGRILTAEEVEEQYGDRIRAFLGVVNTSYKLCRAMEQLQPPVFLADLAAKRWLKMYCLGANKTLESFC